MKIHVSQHTPRISAPFIYIHTYEFLTIYVEIYKPTKTCTKVIILYRYMEVTISLILLVNPQMFWW